MSNEQRVEQLMREFASESRTAEAKTEYVIVMTDESKIGGMFVGWNLHWEQSLDRAQRFEFMTTAIGYAVMTLGLPVEEFEVVPVSTARR